MSSETIRLWNGPAPGALGDGHEDKPHLTPYLVPAAIPAPAVIICPGGAYARRAPHEGEPVARWLNSLGISAFVLDYRVAPYQHPIPLLDARRAVRMVRYRAAEWGIDPGRVGILGFSAGGHLAATAATSPNERAEKSGEQVTDPDPIDTIGSRPDLAILCYPVITFGADRHHGSMMNLLGPEPSDALRHELSAHLQVTGDTPPAFLWHTADDASVPVQNCLMFAEALSRNKVPFALHVFPSGRHGLGLAADHPEVGAWTILCAAWLRERGWGNGPSW